MRPQPDVLVGGLDVDVWPAARGRGEHAGVLDEAAEDGVGDAGHGREHGGGRDAHVADVKLGGHARVCSGMRVLGDAELSQLLLSRCSASSSVVGSMLARRKASALCGGLSASVRAESYFASAAAVSALPGVGRGELAAEALDAAGGVDQLLLAGEERVAGGADFDDDVALVGGARLEVVAAGALTWVSSYYG